MCGGVPRRVGFQLCVKEKGVGLLRARVRLDPCKPCTMHPPAETAEGRGRIRRILYLALDPFKCLVPIYRETFRFDRSLPAQLMIGGPSEPTLLRQ
jgi:hypothetical protein